MLEGPGAQARLSHLRRAFRRHSPLNGPRSRGRGLRLSQGAGLLAFGIFLGAGTVALLDTQTGIGTRSVFYSNCREAIQAGAAPIYRGQSGYAGHLDADNDGIACEPYRRR